MKAVVILILAVALVALILAVASLAFHNRLLRKRMRGLEEPELWLPKAERQAHARKLLKREDEEYQAKMIARLTEVIEGNQPSLVEEWKGKAQ